MDRTASLLALACASMLVAGCGGGGSPDLAPEETVMAGSTEVVGTGITLDVASDGATLYGLTGNISRATYNDLNPTLGETEIYFGYTNAWPSWSIDAVSIDGRSRRFVCNAPGGIDFMRAHPAGAYLYFTVFDTYQLYRVPVAGGTPTPILPGVPVSSFAFTPSGDKIVYRKQPHDGWWKANAGGGSPVKITADTTYYRIWGCLSEDLARMDNWSNPTLVEDMSLTTGAYSGLNNNPVGVSFVRFGTGGLPAWGFAYDANSYWYIFKTYGKGITVKSEFFNRWIIDGAQSDISPSPDGTRAAVPTYPNLVASLRVTDGFSTTSIASAAEVSRCSWGPFIPKRAFLGAGAYPTGAAACIFSEFGKELPAVVLADATTRSSAVLEKVSSPGGPNVVYKLSCDQLTKLHYANNPTFKFNVVVNGVSTGLKGAFISFDAASGDIASVTTFSRAPQVTSTRDGVTLQGGDIAEVVTPEGRRAPAMGETLRL